MESVKSTAACQCRPVRPTRADVLPESPQAFLRNPELLLILNVI